MWTRVSGFRERDEDQGGFWGYIYTLVDPGLAVLGVETCLHRKTHEGCVVVTNTLMRVTLDFLDVSMNWVVQLVLVLVHMAVRLLGAMVGHWVGVRLLSHHHRVQLRHRVQLSPWAHGSHRRQWRDRRHWRQRRAGSLMGGSVHGRQFFIRRHLDMKWVMILLLGVVGVKVRMMKFVQVLVKHGVIVHLAPGGRASQDVFLSVVLGECGLAAETMWNKIISEYVSKVCKGRKKSMWYKCTSNKTEIYLLPQPSMVHL